MVLLLQPISDEEGTNFRTEKSLPINRAEPVMRHPKDLGGSAHATVTPEGRTVTDYDLSPD